MGTSNLIVGLLSVVVFATCVENIQTCPLECPEGEVLNTTTCTCVHPCPQIKCKPTNPRCLNYSRDEWGCQTCNCTCKCPPKTCPDACKYGSEKFRDKFGCRRCRCGQPEYCKKLFKQCKLYCISGYHVHVITQCNLCNCTSCDLPNCKLDCEFGFLLDLNGCEICKCKPKCDPGCRKKCSGGADVDERGCPISQCCEPVCPKKCRPGSRLIYPYNTLGCKTCECAEIN